MAAKGNGVDNPTLSPAIDGQSSGSAVQQEESKGKDLVSELFKEPDAFKFALEWTFVQVPSEVDAKALMAQKILPAQKPEARHTALHLNPGVYKAKNGNWTLFWGH